jgi:hypothetical protein
MNNQNFRGVNIPIVIKTLEKIFGKRRKTMFHVFEYHNINNFYKMKKTDLICCFDKWNNECIFEGPEFINFEKTCVAVLEADYILDSFVDIYTFKVDGIRYISTSRLNHNVRKYFTKIEKLIKENDYSQDEIQDLLIENKDVFLNLENKLIQDYNEILAYNFEIKEIIIYREHYENDDIENLTLLEYGEYYEDYLKENYEKN